MFLPFLAIPKIIQVGVIGDILHSKLVFYPIFIGLIYTLYCQYKYKNVLVNYNKFLKFIIIYFSVMLISLIIGLYNYPYYDLVLNRPVMYFGSSYFIIYMVFFSCFMVENGKIRWNCSYCTNGTLFNFSL